MKCISRIYDCNVDRGTYYVYVNCLLLLIFPNLFKVTRNILSSLFSGDVSDEDTVLEWLIHNRSTGDEEDVIEDVNKDSLEAMVGSVEHLAVLFCK